ncbi:DsrE/DsrF/DrsH-like family protein [Proteiniclasticum sp.]|uniref:DsrE/DsrF/DrsH-like family protein n=1 Tax=Proteiniclasticum sp. TaxID=2053595 RepID=UPI0028A17713|nr:DsrE/DsrF/DrsH-like family protein [Proteiniclasticum sp.]
MSKTIIIGGVATGASAAARLRRMDENMEIVVFEKGEFISFANCGLPYHIGEVIRERDALILQTPKAMNDRFNLDVRVFSEVTGIDPVKKTVSVLSKDRGTYEESFDFLVLSPGAKPLKPAIKGIDSPKVMSLRDIKDMDRIKQETDRNLQGRAIVIGGGFIGVETAENLLERGLTVSLIEAAPHILAPFDSEMSMIVEQELRDRGISLYLEDGVCEFRETGDEIEVVLNSGKIVKGDFVVSAIGVSPDTAFLKDSGIALGQRGHIITDDHLRTNFPYIYAGGDAVEITDYLTGGKTAIPLAGPANRQGRIIADNISGKDSIYKGAIGTSILKVFDMTASSTGMNERVAKRNGLDARSIFIHPNNHAGYYPGATQMTIKLIFDQDRKVLGAQALGYEGVDKFIDVIATVLKYRGSIDDLTELELAYAPPFSSGKSPVNMAGFVAENTMDGLVDNITLDQFQKDFDTETMILLDVRDEVEVLNGDIKGRIHIPLNDLRKRMSEIDKDKEIYIYCQVGLRGYIASRILNQHGFRTRNLTGGFKLYNALNKPAETEGSEISMESKEIIQTGSTIELDATGLCCPGPLMRVKSTMDKASSGDVVNITASDMGFYEDIKAWARRTGNELMDVRKDKGLIKASVRKGLSTEEDTVSIGCANTGLTKENMTMVVFSGDLDKAIASFIIANGAASMDKKVTLFFTFWGINILRKSNHAPVKKNFIEKMFGFMMPKGSEKLGLSKMNMGGIGPKMIRSIMMKKNVQSLEELIKAAMDSGVEIVACQMSMDLLGIKEEELLDGVKFGGVGYMLAESDDSNATLFI